MIMSSWAQFTQERILIENQGAKMRRDMERLGVEEKAAVGPSRTLHAPSRKAHIIYNKDVVQAARVLAANTRHTEASTALTTVTSSLTDGFGWGGAVAEDDEI